MAIVVEFIREYAPWVYGLCALTALWYLRAAVLARRDRRYAVFSLEREAALNRTYGAWSMAFVLISLMGITYFLSTVVSDAVRPLIEVEVEHTPEPLPVVAQITNGPTLPVPEATAPTATPAADVEAADTPTPLPLPTAEPLPTEPPPPPEPAVQGPSCPDGRAIISAPGMNAGVSGMVPVLGTATHEQFQYYKLEFGAGTNPAVWSYFAGGERPVQNGQLGTLNTAALAPGAYSIRIVVVDSTGNYPPPCQTVVNVN